MRVWHATWLSGYVVIVTFVCKGNWSSWWSKTRGSEVRQKQTGKLTGRLAWQWCQLTLNGSAEWQHCRFIDGDTYADTGFVNFALRRCYVFHGRPDYLVYWVHKFFQSFVSHLRNLCTRKVTLTFWVASSPLCWLNKKEFLCITHTVEHNYISPNSTVGIQLHVSALYVGHFQVMI